MSSWSFVSSGCRVRPCCRARLGRQVHLGLWAHPICCVGSSLRARPGRRDCPYRQSRSSFWVCSVLGLVRLIGPIWVCGPV